MFYICDKKEYSNKVEYGVKDTKDGVVEYYSPRDLVRFVKDIGVVINGVSKDISSNKWQVKVVQPSCFVELGADENIAISKQKNCVDILRENCSTDVIYNKTSDSFDASVTVIDFSGLKTLCDRLKMLVTCEVSECFITLDTEDVCCVNESYETFDDLVSAGLQLGDLGSNLSIEYVMEIDFEYLYIVYFHLTGKYRLWVSDVDYTANTAKVFESFGFPKGVLCKDYIVEGTFSEMYEYLDTLK